MTKMQRLPHHPKKPQNLETAVDLLLRARKFKNETVRNALEVARWRRELDDFLTGFPGDDPADRYDTPDRVEHRRFVERLFRGI